MACSGLPSTPIRTGKLPLWLVLWKCDESYFGPERQRGVPGPRKRGLGTLKQPVFGIFERGGAVFTEIVPDVKAKTLQAIIRGKVSPESIVMTDGWQSYDGLADVGYDKHFRLKKYRKEGSPFTDGPVHVNGIESFWSYIKRRLALQRMRVEMGQGS